MLTADGCTDVLVLDEPACCPPPLCGNDLCCTFVAFFNLMPSGPLWDYWKTAAISYFQHSSDPSQCPLLHDPRCPSLILHAIYTVLKLKSLVHDALWPVYRESSAFTAITTLDYHLQRLQWEDCYNQHCRSVVLGTLSPLEVMSECGPLFCPPNYPPELELALKRATATALTRANMGVIKNICGLNWIIEPLGAAITPIYPDPMPPEEPPPVYSDPRTDCDDACGDVTYSICYTKDWLPGVGTGDVCDTLTPLPHVPAYFDWGCLTDKPAGVPDRIWPGVLIAECIIRSMLVGKCPMPTIIRCC